MYCTAGVQCRTTLVSILVKYECPPQVREFSSHTIVGRKGIDDKFQVYTFREYLQALSGVVLHLMIFLILSRLTRSE